MVPKSSYPKILRQTCCGRGVPSPLPTRGRARDRPPALSAATPLVFGDPRALVDSVIIRIFT